MGKKMPKGWLEEYIYNVTCFVKTGVDQYDDTKDYYSTGSIKDNINIPEGSYSFEDRPSRANREVEINDVLQARMQKTDKALLINEKLSKSLFSTGFLQIRCFKNTIDPKYIYFYLKSNNFNSQKDELATGTTQVAINDTNTKKITFPIPPLSEQKRIVTKLDTLFGHLDQLKARLETIPQHLKNFRQSVLTQAVTGKLTESKFSWKEEILSNLTTKVGSGATPKGGQASYKKEGIPLVRSMNIHFNGIKYDGLAYIDELQAGALKNVEIEKGDVLLNITGASIGRVCIAEDKVIGGRVNQHVSILRTNDEILSQFLNLYLASPIMQDLIFEQNYGVTRQALTKTQILNFKIPLPSIEEQKQIVKRVESLFAKADKIEAKYNNLKEMIDQLPQAILAKAFKGELVEQLPSDGDAKELLEEIGKLKP